MTITLTSSQLQQVQASLSTDSTAATWHLLASFGDRYAKAAYEGIAQPTSLYGEVIRNSWAEAGADFAGKFDSVAKDHLSTYVSDIENAFNPAVSAYDLPNSTLIEQSYFNALTSEGVSPYAAIDLSIGRISDAAGTSRLVCQFLDISRRCRAGGEQGRPDRPGSPEP